MDVTQTYDYIYQMKMIRMKEERAMGTDRQRKYPKRDMKHYSMQFK